MRARRSSHGLCSELPLPLLLQKRCFSATYTRMSVGKPTVKVGQPSTGCAPRRSSVSACHADGLTLPRARGTGPSITRIVADEELLSESAHDALREGSFDCVVLNRVAPLCKSKPGRGGGGGGETRCCLRWAF